MPGIFIKAVFTCDNPDCRLKGWRCAACFLKYARKAHNNLTTDIEMVEEVALIDDNGVAHKGDGAEENFLSDVDMNLINHYLDTGGWTCMTSMFEGLEDLADGELDIEVELDDDDDDDKEE